MQTIPKDLILFIGAILVTWLVFTALIKVIKTSISTALSVAALILLLQLVFGVNPEQLWQQITHLPQIVFSWFKR